MRRAHSRDLHRHSLSTMDLLPNRISLNATHTGAAGFAALVTWCAILLVLLPTSACWSSLRTEEEKLGRHYAAQLERHATLVQGDATERVVRIGKVLAEIACTTEVPARYGSSEVCRFNYRFKVIEDSDVNAFSLPGGHIYVNTGLLDLVDSDDELAGVLAHEIAHAAHHHMTSLLRRQSSVDKYIAIVTLAGILGNMPGRDLNNLLLGAQMVRTGKLSSYTLEAEQDADRTAVAYLARSPYSPNGLLRFMRRLEEKHQQNPTLPLGIYQTHPAPHRRVAAIRQAMKEQGIEADTDGIMDMARATVVSVDEESCGYKVVIAGKTIFQPAPLKSGLTSKERADLIAQAINESLDSGITSADIWIDTLRPALYVRGVEIIKVEPEDAPNADAVRGVLERARTAIEYAAWADWLRGVLSSSQAHRALR
ncbi:MAG: M48 family metalloprotease [Armatimonadota bacterium]